jgi:hypothetical protein
MDTYYFGEIVEVFSGHEATSRFVFICGENEEVEIVARQIHRQFRGCDREEKDDIWCDGTLIKSPSWEEISREEFIVLRKYLNCLHGPQEQLPALLSVSETDIRMNLPSGSCWIDNGSIAVYVIFDNDQVYVEAAPVGDGDNQMPITATTRQTAIWRLPPSA